MKNNLITTSFCVAMLALSLAIFAIGASFYQHPQVAKADSGYPNYFGGSTTTPPLIVSTGVQVGPQNSVTVLSTSTARVFAYLSVASSTPVFCSLAYGSPASLSGSGIAIGTSSPAFKIDLEDLYTGAIQCMSPSSTTISVTAAQ